MSNTLLATVVIAGVVGASSAAVTGALMAPTSGDNEIQAVATKADLAGSELMAEVSSLRDQNVELADRIVDLEMRISMVGSEPRREPAMASVDPELEKMKADMATLLSSMQGESAEVPASFTASVGTALATIRDQEEAERTERRTERRAERTEKRLTDLAEKLGLNSTQVNDLREHTLAFDEKRSTLFAEARELGDFGSMRETMGTLRDENNAALQNIFSPAQYQQYEDEGLGDRGGRGGRGGGNATGGGGNNNNGGGATGGGGRRGNRGGF